MKYEIKYNIERKEENIIDYQELVKDKFIKLGLDGELESGGNSSIILRNIIIDRNQIKLWAILSDIIDKDGSFYIMPITVKNERFYFLDKNFKCFFGSGLYVHTTWEKIWNKVKNINKITL